MQLTDRDMQIIRALTVKVRLLSFTQIRDSFWPTGDSGKLNARRRLAELVERGLLEKTKVIAEPLLDLTRPVIAWRPGQEKPDAAIISSHLNSRWQNEPVEMTVYLPARKAIALFGGKALGEIKNRYQVTHDLHVSGIYLYFLKSRPKLAEAWLGEEILASSRKGQKLPDAILHDETGTPRLVIEFGGKYPVSRVTDFHDDCENRGLPYELW